VTTRVRSGELFAALSLATDLGTGQQAEHGLRTCLLAIELAELAGLEGAEIEDAFYLGLLHSIGCTADSPVTARAFGDDGPHKAAYTLIDAGRPVEVVTYLWRNVYPTAPPPQRLRAFMAAVAAGPQFARVNLRSHCEVGERLGTRLRLPARVCEGLWFVFERWDGKGMPAGVAGEEIPIAARILHAARDASAFAAAGGTETIGELRCAAWLHDLGRVGVSSAVWEKPGPLTSGEWEQVRLHSYHTERLLARIPALAELARTASSDHERLDGSGYHRGASGAQLPRVARVLAVADSWCAMTEPRSYRPALTTTEAADVLRREANAGRLAGEAVDAVLESVGEPARPVAEAPAGLTTREVEVLRMLARGMTNKQTGQQLEISPKTVGRHVESIYSKIGASTRAAAALFAVEHDLLEH
jgi:HD-GYP domain-containing protein (c-di-GMP phosphodiesterase class II)